MTKGKIYQLSRYGSLLIVNAAVKGKNNQIRQIKLLVDNRNQKSPGAKDLSRIRVSRFKPPMQRSAHYG